MTPSPVGRLRADAPRIADPAPPSRLSSRGAEGRPVADSRQDGEIVAALQPMLEAIVRLAGADAGTIKVIGQNGASFQPVVTVGLAQPPRRVQSWCTTCVESRDADSPCVRSDLCGHDDRIPADARAPCASTRSRCHCATRIAPWAR